MISTDRKAELLSRIEKLNQIPTIPAVLGPLLRYLQQPVEDLDVQKVTDMIAQDKSLAAQCLQMSNSALFGSWQKIDSLRGAVVALGFQRVADIAMSCGVLRLTPAECNGIDPVVFWEHSLGCALVCRQFARKISYAEPGKAYLAGLLHDLGIIANLWALPQEFGAAFDLARREQIPLHEAEHEILGFNHCESGLLLADRWELSEELCEVVSMHHAVDESRHHANLVALVELSDLLCRMTGLNHGFVEAREISILDQKGFSILSRECEALAKFDWARLTFELDSYMDEVQALVRAIYRK